MSSSEASVATGTGIDFSQERWERLKNVSSAWWNKTLGRPMILMTIAGRDPGRPRPEIPEYHFASHYDESVPAEAIVDMWDYRCSCHWYLGDAFPMVFPNFGAGSIAAYMGAQVTLDTRTVWFHPQRHQEIGDFAFALDRDNIWWRRSCALLRAADARWQGLVQVSMVDLGGNLDILSAFRPGEELLLDLYDEPEEVIRQTWAVHERWWEAFDELNALMPHNPGYSAWAGLFSVEPHYMLQCDFCYMIGPEMFAEFVKPELAASCKRLRNAFYHLDGPGQLPHLDHLLEIEELRGIQWIPGDGQKPIDQWLDVYKRIHEAGKLIQIYTGQSPLGYRVLDVLADHLGTAEGIILCGGASAAEEDEVRRFLESYGVV